MLTKLIKIGNSKGVRIPKSFIKDLNLTEEVQLERHRNFISIKPITNVRKDWDVLFRKSTKHSDTLTEDLEFKNEFDDKEWEW
jgi:antitoxin MazE